MASVEVIVLDSDSEEEDSKVLPGSDPNEQLHKVTSDNLLQKDFNLDEVLWVNDLVINSYFDLIVERSKKEGYASIYAFDTFFYTAYIFKGYQSIKRWTQKIDIFSYDLNFVPIHMGVHWCLVVIDHRSRTISYYDSMVSELDRCVNKLSKYLCEEYKDKKGQILDPNVYVKEIVEDLPKQMNGIDSGIFTLKYAEYVSRAAEITFTQLHMGYFRERMTQEFLHKRLLPNPDI